MSNKRGRGGVLANFRDARNPPREPTASFTGKTVLVTGANTGLGLEAAVKFASLGAENLILGVRNLTKGEMAKTIITSRTSIPSDAVLLRELDCNSFSSVAAFARNISGSFSRIDVALLNAGIAAPSYSRSADGWESTIQVNLLVTAQLALDLLPKMRDTARTTGIPSIINIVGSEAFLDVRDDWIKVGLEETVLEHFNKQENFDMQHQYHISKTLLMFFQEGIVREMEKSKDGNDPVIVVSTPGMCRTDIGREFGFGIRAVFAGVQMFIARSSEQGSRTLVTSAAQGREAHGRFWMNDGYSK
ncbi:MAG: hypothetical protein Q9157_001593 [Trypethelium eluteriae]